MPISSAGNDQCGWSGSCLRPDQPAASGGYLTDSPGSRFPPEAASSTVMEADKQVDIAAMVQ